METTHIDTTAARMIEFLNKMGQRGDINPSTASAWAATAKKMLSIESNWEGMDIGALNVDEFVNRFKNLKRMEYKDGSIEEYEARFRRVIKMFLGYAKDPSTWKAPAKSVPSKKADGIRNEKIAKRSVDELRDNQSNSDALPSEPLFGLPVNDFTMIDYPFPLRDKCIARLRLPVDLKTVEVERLIAFMKSIATDSHGKHQ